VAYIQANHWSGREEMSQTARRRRADELPAATAAVAQNPSPSAGKTTAGCIILLHSFISPQNAIAKKQNSLETGLN